MGHIASCQVNKDREIKLLFSTWHQVGDSTPIKRDYLRNGQ